MAIAAGGIISAAAEAGIVEVSKLPKEENNNNRNSLDQMNGHAKVAEEVDGVPKSPSVDTRNNNIAALGETATGTAAATPESPKPAAVPATGAISKEGNNYSHLERLYDNQEMVIRMMTANLGRPEEEEDALGMNSLHMLAMGSPQQQQQFHQQPMYDIPVSPPTGE